MLTLYHSPGELSSRIVWLLEELQADYELVITAFPKADGSGADPRNPHPHGYTPALVHHVSHDGQLVTETGAIALYLTDLFPAADVGVPVGHPLRGAYVSWLFYQVGMTEPLVNMKAAKLLQYGERVWGIRSGTDDERIDATIAATRDFFERMGIPTRLSAYGVGADSVPTLVAQLEAHGMATLGEHRDVTLAVSRRVLEAAL